MWTCARRRSRSPVMRPRPLWRRGAAKRRLPCVTCWWLAHGVQRLPVAGYSAAAKVRSSLPGNGPVRRHMDLDAGDPKWLRGSAPKCKPLPSNPAREWAVPGARGIFVSHPRGASTWNRCATVREPDLLVDGPVGCSACSGCVAFRSSVLALEHRNPIDAPRGARRERLDRAIALGRSRQL